MNQGCSKRSECEAKGFSRNAGVLTARRSEAKGPPTKQAGLFQRPTSDRGGRVLHPHEDHVGVRAEVLQQLLHE